MAKFPKVTGYELMQQIGGGGFSTVYQAVNMDTEQVAACKLILLTPQTTPQDRKSIEKEMRVHAVLKHINILEFINAVVVETEKSKGYVPGYYILLEMAAGGDLFDKISPDIGLEDDLAHLYFNQLVDGMAYIHNEGVCHRDLKPENLLLDITGRLKISDFGLCSVYKVKDKSGQGKWKERTLTERCGSLPYVAPELNSDDPYAAEPVDLWGMGIILFTMLVGNTPWDEPTQHSVEFVRFLEGVFLDDDPWNKLGQDALSLILGLLNPDPVERFKISNVKAHPWCMRPSQLASMGPIVLATRLTQGLRDNGDLVYAEGPTEAAGMDDVEMEDSSQMGNGQASQFTQNLMLFSQTQSGVRYTPHLTRFYASVEPENLLEVVKRTLETLGVKVKINPSSALELRVGGYDRRRMVFKGNVNVEPFLYRGMHGSFCVMSRDTGNPISWRQLWKALICSDEVAPCVLRKN